MVVIACAFYVGSSPCKRIFLLGIAHPVVGPPFKYRETMLLRGHDCEGGRHVALSNIFVKSVLYNRIL